jgi:phage tail sheath protein FI
MATYRTPGVYVEEISTLPPSVAEVATAVPAFIGYTERGPDAADEPVVLRVATMLEFETAFGGAQPLAFIVTQPVDAADLPAAAPTVAMVAPARAFSLYYAIAHYFRNGGGPCYVVSLGDYSATPSVDRFANDGLGALEKEDEPTLIVLTDAACVLPAADYYAVCGAALGQCRKLGDRFTIIDVAHADAKVDVDVFRNSSDLSINLMYGAAYHPYLQTSLVYRCLDAGVGIRRLPPGGKADAAPTTTLADIRHSDTGLYNQARALLDEQRVVLPPSAAMAGIYARVDRERGVWKTPANAGVMAVLGPVAKITDDDQDRLNIDPTAGKSINAIRAFTGKGTLVWGGRTLAGNDNEWRYVSVRRLFITIEENTRKASAFAVFEPNDQSTWLKVKAMIESYLYGLWEQGALAGAKPEAAYYVHVGLGTTMTPQDVLEGRMVVEIGVAAVRPAEFIVLRFSHKLQTA